MSKPAYNSFLGLDPNENTWDAARYCVIQAPLEYTSSFQSGCSKGPQAVLRASEEIQRWDEELLIDPSAHGIATLDVEGLERMPFTGALEHIEKKTSYVLECAKFPLLLGGEQTIALAALKALRQKHPQVGVVFFDCFLNLKNKVSGSMNHHRSITRRCLEADFSCWHLGARRQDEDESVYSKDPSRNLKSLALLKLREGLPSLELLNSLIPKKRPLYLSIDLGVLDPSVCPGVPLPEPGGLHWDELSKILAKIFSVNPQIVGADICGLSPIPGEGRSEYLAARLAQKILSLHSSSNRDDAVTAR